MQIIGILMIEHGLIKRMLIIPSMNYFNATEKANLLNKCLEFDRKFNHQKYLDLVNELEKVSVVAL